jgi:subtilisin family serine protease
VIGFVVLLSAARGDAQVRRKTIIVGPNQNYTGWVSARTNEMETYRGVPVVASQALVKLRAPLSDTTLRRLAQLPLGIDLIEKVGSTKNLYMIHSRDKGVRVLVNTLLLSSLFVYVEPNYILQMDRLPDDARFAEQWALRNTGQVVCEHLGANGADIGAKEAWDYSTGSREQVVAVLDTGIHLSHPDLIENIWHAGRNFTVQVANRLIHCEKGSSGYDFVNNTCHPVDDNGHGTHVAGIIGSRGNNRLGISGVNWDASMVAMKILDRFGRGTVAAACNAIEFTIRLKEKFGKECNVRVMNNSYGWRATNIPGQSMVAAIQLAATYNMLFVASAGNDKDDTDLHPHFPSGYTAAPNILSVTAVGSDGAFAIDIANFGKATVHLAAPGVLICSTMPPGTGANICQINPADPLYDYRSGTSMAAPFVSGAAALALAYTNGSLSTAGLKGAILSSVVQDPSLQGKMVTGGRLNIKNLLQLLARRR